MSTNVLRIGGAALALIGWACAAAPALAQPAGSEPVVGKSAAVNKDSTVNGRVLEIGASIIHKERIRTDGRGSVQLLFIDRTTLTIGPNSDLTIDEYVYDPRKAGKLSVRLQSGLMRIVGGQITHLGAAQIETKPATIGIRGGVADVSTNGVTTTVSNAFGSVTIKSNVPGSTGPVTVPQGYTGTSGAGGGPPTSTPTTQTQINTNNQQFQSKPGQSGGASPTTSTAAGAISGTKTTITSSITPTSSPAPGSGAAGPSGGGSGPAGTNPAASIFSGGLPPQVTTTTTTVQTSSGSAAAAASPPPPPPDKGGPCCP